MTMKEMLSDRALQTWDDLWKLSFQGGDPDSPQALPDEEQVLLRGIAALGYEIHRMADSLEYLAELAYVADKPKKKGKKH